jgi:uncharacterized protein (DUF952 family)
MHIYHIAPKTIWEEALGTSSYQADSLASEGFIHLSTRKQIQATARRFYRGRKELVLLAIETTRLTAPLRWENLEGGAEPFPHLYGLLNLEAVAAWVDFPPLPDGSFEFPQNLP